jgi:hypothetical protein
LKCKAPKHAFFVFKDVPLKRDEKGGIYGSRSPQTANKTQTPEKNRGEEKGNKEEKRENKKKKRYFEIREKAATSPYRLPIDISCASNNSKIFNLSFFVFIFFKLSSQEPQTVNPSSDPFERIRLCPKI